MLKIFCASLAIASTACGIAVAAPVAPTPVPTASAPIVLVREGCGRGFHLGPGGCVPNRGAMVVEPVGPRVVEPVRLPPPCPRGYYRDPRPGVRLCYPRF